ncbi:MarR family winged helix-turn-helix transcriptional regulator [Sinorhizobium fredii]|uniref:MarR family transcriptional regulator protein n=1 Tax=Rhizobium fredii TaxID=380 RepID=A0A2L0HA72_RHIFR|nr:MarR family winged helix-turn-helix transcriptional regulator [Sinorhizobium fredii]AUX78401.1 MarR family transcriptional regulator protein [Sinorhizobium fredii]
MEKFFDLDRFLPFRLNRAAEAVSLRFAEHYKRMHGMTRPEWRTLAALGAYKSLTATQIGGHSGMHKTKVSRAVFALEKRRWLRRREDASDRRIEHLELTALGMRTYQELSSAALEYQAELQRAMGPELMSAIELGLAAIESRFVDPSALAGGSP